MAEIGVFFLEKLSNLLSQETSKIKGAEKQLDLLKSKLPRMQNLLKEADAQHRKYSESQKGIVKQIRDITFRAEDIVDEFIFKLHCLSNRRQTTNRTLRRLIGCASLPSKGLILRDLDDQIRDIIARIESLSAEKIFYDDLLPNLEARILQPRSDNFREPVVMVEVDVIGVEDDIRSVCQMMLCDDEKRRKAVSIVGIGGLGKTTVAKKVFNDIHHFFDSNAWVTVSKDYTIKDLLLRIAKDVNIDTNMQTDVRELGSEILHFLENKKFLIVLDDMWNTKTWDDISVFFPDSKNCSRILITSRLRKVALYADPENKPHELRQLNQMESWHLFRKWVFGRSTITCPSYLEPIGRLIVSKCGGIPLAIKVLGGFLRTTEKTCQSWQRVLDDKNWHLNEGDDSCMAILALSYNDLPYHLKPCFLYSGIFPEDAVIRARTLIWMWISEGFVERVGVETKVEDKAQGYLEELVSRGLIQVMERRGVDDGIKSCRMHDLVRELAISEAREVNFFNQYEHKVINPRRLVIHKSHREYHILDSSSMRSLICFSETFDEKIFRGLRLLTVLKLEGVINIETLPEEICELTHLNFLSLKGCQAFINIPSSIGKLFQLVTLDLRDCGDLKIFPSTIFKLCKLKYLYGSERGEFSSFRDGDSNIRQLVKLRKLSLRAGDWLKDGLEKLTHLKKLHIWGNTQPYETKICESVERLTNLESLLLWSNWELLSMGELPELKPLKNHTHLYKMKLYGNLAHSDAIGDHFYPPNLTVLELGNSMLNEYSILALGKLPNLRVLVLGLSSYMDNKLWCSSSSFPSLCSLQLSWLSNLEEWDVDEGAFPLLRNLDIFCCRRLKMLPRGLLCLQKLVKLEIHDPCPELENEIMLTHGEDWNRLRRIASIQH